MATISENLQTLATTKANIKSAIEGKGQDLTDVPFTQYAEKINAIETGSVSATLTPEVIAGIWKGVLGDESQIVMLVYYIFSLKEDEQGNKLMKMFSIDDFESGTFTELPYTISGNNVIVDENGDEPLEFTYSFEEGKMTLNSDTFPVPLTKVITGMGENEDNINPLVDVTENGLYTPKTLNDTEFLFFGANVNVPTSSGGIDRLQWKCDNVKSLKYEFDGYKGTDLSILEGLDTSQVENWDYAFNMSSVETLPILNISSANRLYYTFYLCEKLLNFPIKHFHDGMDLRNSFTNCKKMKYDAEVLDLGKPTNLYYSFRFCESLDSEIVADLINCTSIDNAFYECGKIPKLTLTNTQNITNMNHCCYQCQSLTEFNVPTITPTQTTLSNCFYFCQLLKTIKTIDCINVKTFNAPFDFCYVLENLDLRNIKGSLKIGSSTSWGTLLTNASLLNTAQELWDNTNNAVSSSALKLTLSTPSKTAIQSIYVKLVDVTDEMTAQDQYIANKKPCVECASTDEGAMTLEEFIISKNWTIA